MPPSILNYPQADATVRIRSRTWLADPGMQRRAPPSLTRSRRRRPPDDGTSSLSSRASSRLAASRLLGHWEKIVTQSYRLKEGEAISVRANGKCEPA
jgi:hypothetical protein